MNSIDVKSLIDFNNKSIKMDEVDWSDGGMMVAYLNHYPKGLSDYYIRRIFNDIHRFFEEGHAKAMPIVEISLKR